MLDLVEMPELPLDTLSDRLSKLSPLRQIAKVTRHAPAAVTVAVWASDELPERSPPALELFQHHTDVPVAPEFDVEEVALEAAEGFAFSERWEFLKGDGLTRPAGLLTRVAPDDNRKGNELGFIRAGADVEQALDDLVSALRPLLRVNARFVMNRPTHAILQRYEIVRDHPVTLYDEMPVFRSGFAVAFGDFERGYTIVDGDMKAYFQQHSPHLSSRVVVRRMIGGGVTNFDAIKLLKTD